MLLINTFALNEITQLQYTNANFNFTLKFMQLYMQTSVLMTFYVFCVIFYITRFSIPPPSNSTLRNLNTNNVFSSILKDVSENGFNQGRKYWKYKTCNIFVLNCNKVVILINSICPGLFNLLAQSAAVLPSKRRLVNLT